jgi:hypothetical protein
MLSYSYTFAFYSFLDFPLILPYDNKRVLQVDGN